jgi:hypothetical protein
MPLEEIKKKGERRGVLPSLFSVHHRHWELGTPGGVANYTQRWSLAFSRSDIQNTRNFDHQKSRWQLRIL